MLMKKHASVEMLHLEISKRSMRRLGKSVVDGERWVDTDGDGDADADEVVVYRLLVKNIGTMTLRSIVLSDGAVDRDRISCDPSLPDSLAPEEGFECHATYTVRWPPAFLCSL